MPVRTLLRNRYQSGTSFKATTEFHVFTDLNCATYMRGGPALKRMVNCWGIHTRAQHYMGKNHKQLSLDIKPVHLHLPHLERVHKRSPGCKGDRPLTCHPRRLNFESPKPYMPQQKLASSFAYRCAAIYPAIPSVNPKDWNASAQALRLYN